jgi:predicted RNA-binding protein
MLRFLILALSASLASLAVLAQAPKTVTGTVTKVTAAEGSLTVRSDAGEEFVIKVASSTRQLKIPVGGGMKDATPLQLSEVSVGDRALASVAMMEGANTIVARTLAVNAKSELDEKAKAEADDWQKRGQQGLVSAVDPAAGTVKLKKKDAEGKTVEVAVKAAEKVEVKKYRDDSLEFSKALDAKFSDAMVGDQIRVLGNTVDGTVVAERVVLGRFRTVGGRVKKLDLEKGEITIDDLDSKKPLTIEITPNTVMKKMQPMVAFTLARQLNPTMKALADRFSGAQGGQRGGQGAAGQGAAGQGAAGQGAGGSGPRNAGAGGGGMMGGGMMGGGPATALTPQQVAQMLERQPKLAVADLKEGDDILVTASPGTPGRAKALSLMAGVEAILMAVPDVGGGVSTGLGQAGLAGAF